MIITQEAYDQLNFPKEITREDIGNHYCRTLFEFDMCPYLLNHNCNTCLPKLQVINSLTFSRARSIKAVGCYYLKQIANGTFDQWPEQKKGSPAKRDKFGLANEDPRSIGAIVAGIGSL
jgi:hypothetical protein